MKKALFLMAALLLSIAVMQPAQARLQVGDAAPDFSLADVNGVIHHLSDFEGQVVVLNFWQST